MTSQWELPIVRFVASAAFWVACHFVVQLLS
jgi:hypothetical protein